MFWYLMNWSQRSILAAISIALCSLLFISDAAVAQYFGRNKVQYESFDFHVMHTDHFDVHYYPPMNTAAHDAARMVERWYTRLSKAFDYRFAERKSIILYADPADFQQTNVISGEISEATGGVTEGLRDRVILPLTGVLADNDHVIGHELVHVFQYDYARSSLKSMSGLQQTPLWMVEGLAEYFSQGREDPHTAMWMRDAVLNDDIPTISQLSRDFRYFPYRFGQAIWAYVGGRWGDDHVRRLFIASQRMGVNSAIDSVLGISSDSLSKQWARELRATYEPVLRGRGRPSDAGTLLISSDHGGGHTNLAPSISPDGRYVAFLSERDLFSIDLFLADAQTGKVLGRLASAGASPHIDALSFMNSSGTWSPDGKKFAFVTFVEGDNEIAIVDVESRRIERQLRAEPIGAIETPAWSPDGRSIAFTGSVGGIKNLYVLDLQTNAVRQLTNDVYAELQPAWSPDGQSIACVTDRGEGTSIEQLTYAPVRLAIVNVVSGRSRLLAPFSGSKHINPQYASDGHSIYFVSDREGFNDVYRIVPASGQVFRVTKLATGTSGLSHLSPSMSVAARQGTMAFAVFDHRDYNIYVLEPDRTHGERLTDGATQPLNEAPAAILPPLRLVEPAIVSAYLRDDTTGLPPAGSRFETSEYSPSLGLTYIGQGFLGVAMDRYGAALGGGISFLFSDLLGNRNLGAVIQSSGGLKDIGGQVMYANLGHRWNWGASISHVPYLTATTRVGTGTTSEGQLVRVYEQFRQRVFVSQASLVTMYPLNATQRYELNVGYSRIGYDLEVERVIATPGGFILDQRTQGLESPPGFNLVQGSMAFVGDFSTFGFTSPVSGGRYRLEVGPTFGALQFYSVLADYRRYLFARPFTLAFRGLHYGRYGRDSESNQLTPLFIGYETLVRGYSINSFDPAECTSVPGDVNACPEFDRLIGSRIAVTNLELRIPLFGNEQFGLINFPFLPLELVGFLDGGLAWNSTDRVRPDFTEQSLERIPVFSAGGSVRVNLFGYLVAELYYAKPFQRPMKGAHWGFSIAPGW
jgi:Tol biopolymer transport system component